MDPDSPLTRVERTLWTVWAYITGAVNRFLRPQTANDVYNDPNSFQESAVDCEPSDCGPAEGDVGRWGVDEEQPQATAAQLSSSRPVVVWELSPGDIHMKPDEESVRYRTNSSRSSEKEESTDGEEQISQTIKEDEQEKREIEEFGAQGETPEDDDEMSEAKAGDEEETATPDEHQVIDETVTKTHVKEEECKMHHEGEQDLKAGEVKLCTMMDSSPEEEDEMLGEDADMQKDDAASVVTEEKAETCDDALQLVTENKSDEGTEQEENPVVVCEEVSEVLDDELIDVGQEKMMVDRREMDTFEDEGVKEDEREQEEQNNEATSNQTTDEEPEQEKNITTVTDDSQEENKCEETETWLQPAELTDIDQEEVAVTQVRTKTVDVAITCASLDDKDEAEEERLFSEVGDKDVEVECPSTSVTVKPEGETGQEMSGELGNTPPGISEGQVVVSQQLNTPTCEETQEGVPGYNNELGPDENTTQRFLEVGDYEETRTTWLPEEVESTEQESLQNSGWSTGADYLPVKEPMEEKQEGTEGIEKSSDFAVEKDTGIQQLPDIGSTQETEEPRAETLESGHVFEGGEGELLESSMKTEIKRTGLSEELLVDFGIDGGFCDSKEADGGRAVAAVGLADEISEFLEAEMQKMTETSFSQESVLDEQTEQNSSRTPSLPEDTSKFTFLRPLFEMEPEIVDHSGLEVVFVDDMLILEEMYGEKEEEAEDETHLQEAGTAAELITEVKEKENNLITESLLSQSPDRAPEIREEEMMAEAGDALKAAEFKPEDSSAGETAEHVRETDWSHTDETSDSISGRQEVIDEEILDLWIEAAMSADTDGLKQEEEPEPEQQIDTETDPLNEKQGDITSEKDKEQLMEPNSGESGVASDTEMSSSIVESEFFNQSISEWDAQNSESQLLKSASTGSLHDIQDMLVSTESADISEFSAQTPNSESKDGLIEETAEKVPSHLNEETGFYPKSPEEMNLNQESHESQEKTDEERVEATSTSQTETDVEVTNRAEKTDWKDKEEVDVTPLMKMSTSFQIEDTKFENEPLEISMSDSAHEIEHSGSRSGSEASLEEELVSVEPDSQGETWTEKRLLKLPSPDEPQWSKTESPSEPKRPEEAEEPTTTSDQEKVVTPALDFTVQRSRIAVKNPRVRPPKDPRSLLQMPSVDPTPSTHEPVKAPKGVPLGGLGIGIKLPGLGAGFPVLKKTQRVVKEENSQETPSQEPEVKPEEKSDAPQQDEAQHKPKWMPPRHPGFGNPLMSELKTKLKKTTQESE